MQWLRAILVLSSITLFSCASTDADEPMVSVENDPRIGEEVNQACFIRSINGWSNVDNDDKALIVTLSRRNQFKLNLSGPCDANWAMYRIAIIGKTGSSCIQRGDRVKTDADTMRGLSCMITSINEWHPEKLEEMNKEQQETEQSK
ncbi:DUF6491 family protein [Thalassotalea sp. PLHSN55]|uniref:DUF6491 family protein n=1 Tax=Thalassotalea sp. PLHSN55 TaxID=3435888 RepID=UPI003F8411A7